MSGGAGLLLVAVVVVLVVERERLVLPLLRQTRALAGQISARLGQTEYRSEAEAGRGEGGGVSTVVCGRQREVGSGLVCGWCGLCCDRCSIGACHTSYSERGGERDGGERGAGTGLEK